mmetsp:Transcript_24936/g.45172  ORF Transcript_24936/g.45172 Transcript_24936/m.45172 type:complete len:110 (-) Transcript_24936:569-898(-)
MCHQPQKGQKGHLARKLGGIHWQNTPKLAQGRALMACQTLVIAQGTREYEIGPSACSSPSFLRRTCQAGIGAKHATGGANGDRAKAYRAMPYSRRRGFSTLSRFSFRTV